MSTRTVVFDVETCALPESEIQQFMPEFEAPSNFKDPDKIKAAIEAKKKAWLKDAALDPMTGRVLAIGLMVDAQFVLISEPATEAMMLHEFWDAIQDWDLIHNNRTIIHLVGFNCCLFDLPFLIRRSWKLGVEVTMGIRWGRYWGDHITDLRDVWQMGDRQAPGSLDTIAKYLGIGAKTGSGKDFAALWHSDRDKAVAYLKNDLELTAAIARKLGVV